MTLYYHDPINPQLHWEAGKTAQIGFTDHGDRTDMSNILARRGASVFDLYRAPSFLLADIFAYPSFLRVMDYLSYKIVEDQIRERIRHMNNPEEASPIIVYGARNDQLIDHISIINGSTTHPRLISAYYLQATKGF
jgi:hypothetical protein